MVAKTRAVIEHAVVKSMVAHINLPVNAGGDVCARVVGGELQAAAKKVTVPTSVRRFRKRPAAGARSRLIDRVRGTHHECEMFVRTVQDAVVFSGTLIIRVLRFEASLGFVETAANAFSFEEFLRYVEDCYCFEEWSRSKSESPETSRDWHCVERASCTVNR